MTTTYYIDAALADLPRAPAGTPLAREVAAIERHLLVAKARLATLERKAREAAA